MILLPTLIEMTVFTYCHIFREKKIGELPPHIFAIGDIVGQPMLAHKAVHEAHVAAEVIAGELQGNKELAAAAFNARVIPSVAYTDPEVAWVGWPRRRPGQGARHQGQEGLVPMERLRPCHCEWPRRRCYQAVV